jgi:hypothetical protein
MYIVHNHESINQNTYSVYQGLDIKFNVTEQSAKDEEYCICKTEQIIPEYSENLSNISNTSIT